ncbi:D-2-hydroxyacid dehydrogenase [Kitasatospora indigofera]|uniref:D-2-hydroxyacid dehydrogenase n=1 Tax=Kitasatospora indigofera TaxID=67307 RepID=UPI00364A3F5C
MSQHTGNADTVHYLSTLSFPEAWLDELRAVSPRLVVEQITATAPEDVPAEVWARTDVLHTGSVFPAPGQAPRLSWIQLDTSGADHLRGTPVWDSPAPITSIGGISPVPMAEYVMMMVLGLAHRLPRLTGIQQEGRWPSLAERWDTLMPRRLAGATVGVVGYGRIGREIGRLATAHRMTVLGLKRGTRGRTGEFFGAAQGEDPAELYTPDRFHEFLARCDYLVLTCPLTDETRGMMDRAAFEALKPGAALINVSRGGIADEDAMTAALRSGRLSGAALDVFDTEPLPAGHPLWTEPGVIISPHVAGFSPDYEQQVLDLVTGNLARHLEGRPLLNLVDRVRGY